MINLNTINGFDRKPVKAEVKTVTAELSKQKFGMQDDFIHEKFIKIELAEKLVHHIIENDLMEYKKDFRIEDYSERYRAKINVCPPGLKFQSVENDTFIVNGEHFTEDELIEAVKNTYPDRLI
jgi:hypothetical protein